MNRCAFVSTNRTRADILIFKASFSKLMCLQLNVKVVTSYKRRNMSTGIVNCRGPNGNNNGYTISQLQSSLDQRQKKKRIPKFIQKEKYLNVQNMHSKLLELC